jgi:hypothetical protein
MDLGCFYRSSTRDKKDRRPEGAGCWVPRDKPFKETFSPKVP